MTPIEKVARAICNSKPRSKRFMYLSCVMPDCSCKGDRKDEARAAIEAMREPLKAWLANEDGTAAMIVAKSDELTDAVIDAMLGKD